MARGRLTRKIGIVALGRAAGTSSIFAVNYILVRSAWTKGELGIFLAILAVGNTLAPIFLLGLPTSLLYFFPHRNRSERKGLLLLTLLCLVGSGGLLVGLLFFLGPQLAGWLEPEALAGLEELGGYLLPFLPYLFSLVAGGFVEASLVAVDRPQWAAGLAITGATGLVVAAVAGAALALNIAEVLLLFSAVGSLRLVAGLLLVARGVGFGLRGQSWSRLGEYLEYSLPVWMNDAVGSLSRYVDRLVVIFFFSAATFANYQLGAVEVPISLLLGAVVTVLVPEVSRLYGEGRMEEIGMLWHQAVGRLALVVLPVFCFLFVFAEPVIELYLTKGYAESRWVFRIFLLALPLRCAVYNPLLMGMGKARWALWGSLGDLFLNASLSIILVKVLLAREAGWAFLGPAMATVGATYAQVFLLVGLIAWQLRWGVRQLLPWGRLLRVSGFSGGAALVGWGAAGWAASAQLELIVGGGVFGVVLAGFLWASRRDRDDLGAILGSMGRGGTDGE